MFEDIQKQVRKNLKKMLADGVLFRVETDREKVWQTYLSAFSEETRQSNNCNCCKSFIRQYAGIVGIKGNQKVTLWDFETDDEEYSAPIKALGDYIRSLPVAGIFLNPFSNCGTEKNLDSKRNLIWTHFHVALPKTFVVKEPGSKEGAARDNKNVLQRSLEEITDDAVDTTLELISQNSLYRGQEFLGMIQEFKKIKDKYKKIKNTHHKDNFCWVESGTAGPAISRIRNSAIGTLLNNLSEGMDLDRAVTAFERVVAPTNYRRPENLLVTPKMIESAKTRLAELGLTDSLHRRLLSTKDLTVNNSLFVYRSDKADLDIFDELKKDVTVNPKTLSKIEEVSIDDFIQKIIPTAKSIKVLVENRNFGNFVSLVGPKTTDGKVFLKWQNNYSWTYTGSVADSIRERVKAAGGNVDGVLRVSLSWSNTDDLDLHVIEPGGHKIYYPVKRILSPSGGTLDIDANGGDGLMENPVENIYWTNLPKIGGEYQIIVNQFDKRGNQNGGFETEVQFESETYNFSCASNGATGHNHKIARFNYTKKDGFTISGGDSKPSKYNSKEKWGISSGRFHRVNSICLSPNHWDSAVGNKHYMFFLEGCKTDERVRPFYNEMLRPELNQDRKVFEILGAKLEAETTENELSGLGFSDTVRNELIIEVTGKFKRQLRVKF